MLKIFCWFGWHTWEENIYATKRTCTHCNKKQHILNDGSTEKWVD